MDHTLNFFKYKESYTLIGVFLTLCFSVYSLIRTSKLTKNGYYIKEVTGLRAKYIESLRKQVAEFTSHALELSKASFGSEKIAQLFRDLELSYGLTKLHLNEENSIDRNLVRHLDKVKDAAINPCAEGEPINIKINQLLTYTQQVLLFEWQNLKYEAKGKPLRDAQIEEKRKAFVAKYPN
ncbi:hypothetical protein ACTJKN_02595 [Pedobacter sp. 22163]|uniref:hypothetical protein n=1 Tax=Pedobacter sp. 22163 TaxID=3453883 RepID=UPI003F84E00D